MRLFGVDYDRARQAIGRNRVAPDWATSHLGHAAVDEKLDTIDETG